MVHLHGTWCWKRKFIPSHLVYTLLKSKQDMNSAHTEITQIKNLKPIILIFILKAHPLLNL